MGKGRFKQRALQALLKEKQRVDRRDAKERAHFARIEREIKAAGLQHEPLKPGRYSEYYEHGKGILPPYSFMSMREEELRGSTPGGFLAKWAKAHGIDWEKVDKTHPELKTTPQIRVIPKEELAKYLLADLAILTPENMEKFAGNEHLREVITNTLRTKLAAIDWAEQTHGIKIDVDPAKLKWIGKNK